MKAHGLLLLSLCLSLLVSCKGGSSSSNDSTSKIENSVAINQIENTPVEVTEQSLLESLTVENLKALLDRSLLSKEGSAALLNFYKNAPPDSEEFLLSEKILIKNKTNILTELIEDHLSKSSDTQKTKRLLLAIGDDSYYTLAKIFSESNEGDQKVIGNLFKEIAKEKTLLREVSECGVKEFNSKEDILCGIKSYHLGRDKVCGAERYNTGTDMGCPGAWVETIKVKVPVDCDGDGRRSCYEIKTQTINHTATCEAERFGVKTWKECEDKSFGVAHYNVCTREEFGVKTYNACEIRKTRNELEVYIQGRNADINLNGALLLSNQTLLIKQSRSAETLACFIEKYADNPLTEDVMNDLITNFELLTDKVYSRDLATNCDQVISKTENMVCGENSKSDVCKTKRSLDAANKYFKENLKEVCLLSLDKVASLDPNIKERLNELQSKLAEYVK